jgi:hypothetical protein
MRWAGHAAPIEKMRNVGVKVEEKKQAARPWRTWECKVK